MGLARARLRYALRIRRRAQALEPLRRQAQRRARAAVERGRAHGGRGWRRRNRDFKAGGGAELARRVFEGGPLRAARSRVHGFAASRALFQQGGPGAAERDQRREIRQLRHAHAIDARRQSTARTCRRRHFHRRGNLYQYRGAAGTSSTRSWRPTYAMEAQLCAWIDHAILARDHVGCARYAGLFWYLGLALAPWRGADPRQLALYARGRSSGQQAPGGDAAGIRERRDTRPG